MDLMQAYINVLGLGGLSTTSDAMVQTNITGQNKSAVVKVGNATKRLVLPTDFYLQANQWKGLVAFHIFNENQFNKTETPTMSFLRKSINYRVNIIAHFLAESLLNIAASPEKQSGMGPDLLNIMVMLKDATPQQHEKYVKIIEKLGATDVDRNVTSLFIKKQGQLNINGEMEKFTRVASWSFPLAKLLKEASTSKNGQKPKMDLLGVKLNKKDVEVFTNLFNIIMPGCFEEVSKYQYGSNSRVAPSAEALIHGSAQVLKNLNYLLNLLVGPKPQLKKTVKADNEKVFKTFYTDLDWISKLGPLDNWEAKIRLIPIADGATNADTTEETPVVQKQTTGAKNAGVSMANITQPTVESLTPYNPFPNSVPVVNVPVQPAPATQSVQQPQQVMQVVQPVQAPVPAPVTQTTPVAKPKKVASVSMKDVAHNVPAPVNTQPQVTYINGVAMVPATSVVAQPTQQVLVNQAAYQTGVLQNQMMMATPQVAPAAVNSFNTFAATPTVNMGAVNMGTVMPGVATQQPVLIGYNAAGQPIYGYNNVAPQPTSATAGLGSGFSL